MANALKTLFTDIATAIRTGLPDEGKIAPLNFPSKIEEAIAAGGGSSDLVKYVHFMSEDGTKELFVMPVLIGDNCKDPVEHGDIPTPTKEGTEAYTYTHSGWAMIPNNPAFESALKNVTEDRTVYVAFEENTRYYTVRFFDGDTLVHTAQVAYGGSYDYVYNKPDYSFDGWNPEPVNITENIDCYAQLTPISMHKWVALPNTSFTNNESAAVVYNNELWLIGGALQAKSVYKWNGNEFIQATETLPLRNAIGSKAVVVNNEIHVVGLVPDGQPVYLTKGHAKWTGTEWKTVSTSVPGTFNGVWSAVSYNNELHILSGSSHHKFNGSEWVENISTPTLNANVKYVVFNGEIHGIGATHTKWDGNTWTELNAPLVTNTSNDTVVVFENEVHVFQQDLSHYKWDGNTWTQLDNIGMPSFSTNEIVEYNGYLHVFGDSTNNNMHYMY